MLNFGASKYLFMSEFQMPFPFESKIKIHRVVLSPPGINGIRPHQRMWGGIHKDLEYTPRFIDTPIRIIAPCPD
jgi:hypothetical protein